MSASWLQKTLANEFIRRCIAWFSGPIAAFLVLGATSKGFASVDVKELMWALIAYVFGEHFARIYDGYAELSKRSSELDRIDQRITAAHSMVLSTFERSFRITRVPESRFVDQMHISAKLAYHVKNTYVGISEITGIATKRGQSVISYYRNVLAKGENTSWQDIVGVGDLLDGRFSQLDAVRADILGAHDVYILSTHAPVLNFVMLGGEDGQFSEVYFGWVKGSAHDFDMFHSRDKQLIRMFDAYFESMRSRQPRVSHLPLNYGLAELERLSRSTPHRLRGRWLSIGGPANSLTKDDRLGTPPSFRLWKYSIVSIDYVGEWKIAGHIYHTDGRQVGLFESETCVMVNNSLYYKFKTEDEFGLIRSSGIGAYNLSSGADRLRGYYTGGKHERSSILRAVKLTDEDFEPNGQIKQSALLRALSVSASES